MSDFIVPQHSRFPCGDLYTTAGAINQIPREDLTSAFRRHLNGDWGDLCSEDKTSNEEALEFGTRLLSSYTDRNGVNFWIITEADRSSTTILLPEEY